MLINIRTIGAIIISLMVVVAFHGEAFGQIAVTPGFTVETFAAGVSTPAGMSFGPNGDLFVGNDFNTNATAQIYKITPAGAVSAFGDPIPDPDAVLADAAGNVFVGGVVVATGQARISRISPDGSVTSIFASGGGLGNISDMVFDGSGNVIAPNEELGTISSVSPVGVVSTLATGLDVSSGIAGIAFGLDGNLYLTRPSAGTITKISPTGVILDLSFASGLTNPGSIILGAGGVFGTAFYVTEGNGEISVVSSTGQVTTFASGISPSGLEFGPDGNLYVSQYATGRILRIRPSGATSCVPSPSGLLSWWPGDGNANDVQGSNHGALQNGAMFVPGLVDQAFGFDGVNDYVSSPSNSATGDFTVEFWEKSSSNGLYKVALGFAASASPGTNNLIFDFNDPDWPGGTGLWVYWNGGGEYRITSGSIGSFTNGLWHHIALTRSGANMTLYVNGISAGSTVYAPAIDLSNFDINHIGAGPSPGNFWEGSVDEVSIYNIALSASEIQSIYNADGAGKCKECTPPVVEIIGDDPVFTGTTHTYTATTDATNPSFEWSVTGGTINGISTNSSVSITAGAVGTMMVSVDVTDGITNCSKEETKNVTVNPLPGGSEEVVLATNSVWLKENANVLSGNVIVNNASSGPVLDSQVELSVGHKVTTPTGFSLKANRIKVKQGAVVESDVFYNELMNNGAINGSLNSPLTLPVFASLPAFKQAPPGTQDITVNKDESITLTAGSYRDILVKQKGTILFTGGGTFSIRSLNTGDKAKLLFNAPTEILIEGKLDTDQNSYIGPQSGSGIGAADIIFYIADINGNNGNFGATPKAAQLGLKNTILANFYVPNGTLWLRQGTVATGAFLGRDVIVGENVQVTLESAFSGGSSLANARVSSQEVVDVETSFPLNIAKDYVLEQNYPNPFNPSTMISFALPEDGELTLRIYMLTGQLVRHVASGKFASGKHEVIWNGRDENGAAVASGIYFYQLVVQKENGEAAFTETRRMTLVK